jgi:hypothetical protein
MTSIHILKNAITVAGTGDETVTGHVLRNEITGAREWIDGISLAGARRIVSKRKGTWTVRGFVVLAGQAVIYA